MKRLLLTSCGLCNEEIKKAFLKLIPGKSSNLKIAIISTSQPVLKEKHPKMILAKDTFKDMGFDSVEFIDVEFEDIYKLESFNVILLNGGHTFYLLYHLKKSGADIILNKLIDEGRVIIGVSAGTIALGPDNNLCNYLYSEGNTLNGKDLSALNAVNIRIYPHYIERCSVYPNMAEKISQFESKYNCQVTRLNDGQAILVLDNEINIIG